jgi:MoaA/NifB/PqqE/SkfB family radical SAM enzyme
VGSRKGAKAATPVTFWGRHLQTLTRYGTTRKLVNLTRAYCHYLKGSAHIPTMPAFLKVEISRKCDVHCKFCDSKKADQFYPLGKYQELIDRFQHYVFEVVLHDVGDPLHNEEVVKYIAYAHARRIGTMLSSSLSICKSDQFWESLATSGLDRIVVAIDGLTKDVYNQYRTYGDLDLVMANLKTLLACRARHRTGLIVEWQMLDLPWNRHEQAPAKAAAKALGCDAFRLIPEASQERTDSFADGRVRKTNCLLPYIIFIVDAFGNIKRCYKNRPGDPMTIGSLRDNSFEEIWNGDEIAQIRDKKRIRHRYPCSVCLE